MHFNGFESRSESLKIFTSYFLRYAIDPYALLALLGFLIFLFYVIYSFLNVTSGRSFATSPWKELFDLLGREDWLRYEATF